MGRSPSPRQVRPTKKPDHRLSLPLRPLRKPFRIAEKGDFESSSSKEPALAERAHEALAHIKANEDRELALLESTEELAIFGKIVVDFDKDGYYMIHKPVLPSLRKGPQTAQPPAQRIYFVKGLKLGTTRRSDKNDPNCHTVTTVSAGAAVVYQFDGDTTWRTRTFCLPTATTKYKPYIAGISAISEGLAVALSCHMSCQQSDKRKVVIFTDSEDAMKRIRKMNRHGLQREQLCNARPGTFAAIWRKLVTRSQYFRHLGIEVELRFQSLYGYREWGHEPPVWTAERAASGDADDVCVDEGLRLAVLEIAARRESPISVDAVVERPNVEALSADFKQMGLEEDL